MKIRELNREDARKVYLKICSDGITQDYFDTLDSDYWKIRNDIKSFIPETSDKYEFDLLFAIRLFEYFNKTNFSDFNEAVASNYNFWRYICLKVVPDIIIKRHGLVESYFYEKDVRIYIPTMWWFIEMSYQGDLDTTYNCLKDFSTDFILQFVERPGRDGMYIEVTRCIFYYLSKLPKQVINEKKGNQTLIRRLLIQHTARNVNFNLVVEGKTQEYVKGLFSSCGVEVE